MASPLWCPHCRKSEQDIPHERRCKACGAHVYFTEPNIQCKDCGKPMCYGCRRRWHEDTTCKSCYKNRQRSGTKRLEKATA